MSMNSPSIFAETDYKKEDEFETFIRNAKDFKTLMMDKMKSARKLHDPKSREAQDIYKDMLRKLQDFEKDSVNKLVLNHDLGFSGMGIELMVLQPNWEDDVLRFLKLWRDVYELRIDFNSLKRTAISITKEGIAAVSITLCRDKVG
jgi:hypothetical protein